MHEMAIAVSIVDLAQRHAGQAGGGRISRIELEIGKLAGVLQESLEFCFQAAARETPVEGAVLAFNQVEGLAKCHICGIQFSVECHGTLCPQCGGLTEITGGDGLRVVAITIEDQE